MAAAIRETHKPINISVEAQALDPFKTVRPGEHGFIGDLGPDGIELVATQHDEIGVYCKVLTPGRVKPKRGLAFPSFASSSHTLSEADEAVLDFAIEHKLDSIGLSFAHPQTVVQARGKLSSHGVGLIPKIETLSALEQIEAILAPLKPEQRDGIMNACGDQSKDLYLRHRLQMMSSYAKQVITLGNQSGLFTILATGFFDSMKEKPYPTIAEQFHLGYAFDLGSQGVLISDPVAAGQDPIAVVEHFVKSATARECQHTGSMTKLICTMGPAARSQETLRRMIRIAGGRLVMRINAAHGSPASWAGDLHLIRETASAEGEQIQVEIDTPGEKVRLGQVEAGLVLEPGDIVIFR